MGFIALLMVLALALVAPGLDNRLTVARYTVESEKLVQPVRLALVTDLHSCDYGDGMRELIDAVDAERPDFILLGGDIFDSELPDDNTEAFLRGVAGRYPCLCVTGNHEHLAGEERFQRQMALLDELGITRLGGKIETHISEDQTLTFCGVDDPMSVKRSNKKYKKQVRDLAGAKGFTVLLAHRPEYAELYAECGFDLVLCGHTHGGQVRIPGLLNGLYAPNQGFFPKYAGGKYELGGTTLIVGRGLARESTRVPRFYDRPELVIVDLTGTQK